VRDGFVVEAAPRRVRRMSWRLESPLVNAVLIACKESDNGMADHIFKYLGALRGARAPSPAASARCWASCATARARRGRRGAARRLGPLGRATA
jgi:D-alanyl-D-alanine carboxypeptidase